MPPIDVEAKIKETETLPADRAFWPGWAVWLRGHGLDGPVSILLEAAGPINLLLAQLAWVGQPLFQSSEPGGSWQAFARMLENHHEVQAFATFLREEDPR